MEHIDPSATKRIKRHKINIKITKFIAYVFLSIGGLVTAFPLLWLLSSAFKPSNAVFAKPFKWLPNPMTIENFVKGWNISVDYTFGHFLINSIYLAVFVVIGTVFSSSLVAFGFARLKFKFKNILFILMLSTLMLPEQVTMIPVYLIFKNLGWLNTYLPFIVPSFLGGGAFYIFLIHQFIKGIPTELDESARIDGASTLQIFWHIILPLSKPALFSVMIFKFMSIWNDFLEQLIYISDIQKYTVPLILRTLVDTTSVVSWGPLIALSLIAIVPPILLFFFAQSYFIEGIATTGLKG